jgi:hypothetical protein
MDKGGIVMKIVVTVTDVGEAIHCGGDVVRKSAIIEIPEDQVPSIVKNYFKNKRWAKERPNRFTYQTLSFSLLEEEP